MTQMNPNLPAAPAAHTATAQPPAPLSVEQVTGQAGQAAPAAAPIQPPAAPAAPQPVPTTPQQPQQPSAEQVVNNILGKPEYQVQDDMPGADPAQQHGADQPVAEAYGAIDGGQPLPTQPVAEAQPELNPHVASMLQDARYTPEQLQMIAAMPADQRDRFVRSVMDQQLAQLRSIPPEVLASQGIGQSVDPRQYDPLAPQGQPGHPYTQPDPLQQLINNGAPLTPNQQAQYVASQVQQHQQQQPPQGPAQQFVPLNDDALAELESYDPRVAEQVRAIQGVAGQLQPQLQQQEQKIQQLEAANQQFIKTQVDTEIRNWFGGQKGDPTFGEIYHGPHGSWHRGQLMQLATAFDVAAMQRGQALTVNEAMTQAHRALHHDKFLSQAKAEAHSELRQAVQQRSGLRTFTPQQGAPAQQYVPGTNPEQDQVNAEAIVAQYGFGGQG